MSQFEFRAWNFLTEQMIYDEPVHFFPGRYIEVAGYTTEAEEPEGPAIDVMQYTRCRDFYGQKIFDGDIVHTDFNLLGEFGKRGHIGVISYQYGEFVIRSGAVATSLAILRRNKWKIEAIGNVFENKELLDA